LVELSQNVRKFLYVTEPLHGLSVKLKYKHTLNSDRNFEALMP